jgi:hypothetical protein
MEYTYLITIRLQLGHLKPLTEYSTTNTKFSFNHVPEHDSITAY